MFLSYIWAIFIVGGLIFSLVNLFINKNYEIFNIITQNVFEMAKTGFEVSLGLTGILSLWLGLLKIAERGGLVDVLAKIISPLFLRIFPEIPRNHPVNGTIAMNFAANMLGLDNAATPIGLKAMQQLQELNKDKEKASNSQIMFVVLNASGLTIIPFTIIMYRFQLGALNPTDVFIPIFLTTSLATLAGLISVSIIQKINIFNRIYVMFLSLFLGLLVCLYLLSRYLSPNKFQLYSTIAANFIILFLIFLIVVRGLIKRVNVFESFIDGAKEGINVAIKIIPFLVGILVAIGFFRSSGALEFITEFIKRVISILGVDNSFVEALPTALMKPLSGSGARGMMIEAMKTFGPDSFVGKLSCIFQGTTDTTFYIISVYFGSVGIKNTRYTLGCSLISDFVGIISAIFIAYLFFM